MNLESNINVGLKVTAEGAAEFDVITAKTKQVDEAMAKYAVSATDLQKRAETLAAVHGKLTTQLGSADAATFQMRNDVQALATQMQGLGQTAPPAFQKLSAEASELNRRSLALGNQFQGTGQSLVGFGASAASAGGNVQQLSSALTGSVGAIANFKDQLDRTKGTAVTTGDVMSGLASGALVGFVAGFAVPKIVEFGKALYDLRQEAGELKDALARSADVGVRQREQFEALTKTVGATREELHRLGIEGMGEIIELAKKDPLGMWAKALADMGREAREAHDAALALADALNANVVKKETTEWFAKQAKAEQDLTYHTLALADVAQQLAIGQEDLADKLAAGTISSEAYTRELAKNEAQTKDVTAEIVGLAGGYAKLGMEVPEAIRGEIEHAASLKLTEERLKENEAEVAKLDAAYEAMHQAQRKRNMEQKKEVEEQINLTQQLVDKLNAVHASSQLGTDNKVAIDDATRAKAVAASKGLGAGGMDFLAQLKGGGEIDIGALQQIISVAGANATTMAHTSGGGAQAAQYRALELSLQQILRDIQSAGANSGGMSAPSGGGGSSGGSSGGGYGGVSEAGFQRAMTAALATQKPVTLSADLRKLGFGLNDANARNEVGK